MALARSRGDTDFVRIEKLPSSVPPQLAARVESVPEGPNWAYEVKFDGYRLMCRTDGSSVQLLTRNGSDLMKQLASLREPLLKLSRRPAIFDGELVALDERGRMSFQKLQGALRGEAK